MAAGIRPVWFNRTGRPLLDARVTEIRAFEPLADVEATLIS